MAWIWLYRYCFHHINGSHNVDFMLAVDISYEQDDSTELMLFKILWKVRDISKLITLRSDDLLLSGTLKCVGTMVVSDVRRARMIYDGMQLDTNRTPNEESPRMHEFQIRQRQLPMQSMGKLKKGCVKFPRGLQDYIGYDQGVLSHKYACEASSSES